MRDNASEISDYISHYIKSSAFLQKGVNLAKNIFLAQNPVTINFANHLCHTILQEHLLFPTKNAESACWSSQVGIDAYNKWSLLNRGDLDGQWQLINTWDMKEGALLPAEEIRPNKNGINMYGMFPRFTSKYSKIIETQVVGGADSTVTFTDIYGGTQTLQHVFATCFQSPESDNYSVFITNDSEKTYNTKICFDGLQSDLPLYLYEINEAQKDNCELLLQPLKTLELDNSNSCTITINPMSVICISSYNLPLDANGIR